MTIRMRPTVLYWSKEPVSAVGPKKRPMTDREYIAHLEDKLEQRGSVVPCDNCARIRTETAREVIVRITREQGIRQSLLDELTDEYG